MDVRLRPFQESDFEFVRELYFETMRGAIEPYFGWNRMQQEESFSTWFKPNEARIITADGTDAGWIQQRQNTAEIFLGSIYVTPAMQGKGIGTSVIQDLLHLAGLQSQAVTLAVMKINPAIRLYRRLGFHATHEDDYKVYMRADPKTASSPLPIRSAR